MIKYIALLRGINVAGKRKVLMADLKDLFAKLGFTNCITYIQSGNVVFELDKEEDNIELAHKIEAAILEHFKLDVPVIIRKAYEWEQLISDNPFFKNKRISIDRQHLTLLDEEPKSDKVEDLKKKDFGMDQFEIIGQHVFLCCTNKYSETKMTNGLLEKKFNCKATTRNWKTVLKLLELSK
ncbi:DUF1697 domain-containing protein [Ancylomarina sp.]|uniref:DUF1697 domain-containing protein n=1 Tax=Ancylomarina sp. TaxID=1970196 RepID=UPI00356A6CCD